ncbi:MAG: DNA topoisomerase III [Proteobacteria bacterium]|jgi:DNA topoisomerase-3|uniref:DNA topoisomerase n=17 Tax=cellular organisms TaxID=131567 RepID=A0A6V1RIL6_HETAK|nr:DNA topoisomerase III [Methylibium sp.]MCH8855524.1 DNA topoisomerase III [Pseudomonadota bacterium]|mmetsp:Transcript_9101/g.17432  ORF Transcript_9101/g.17432 Transcript_9101/m.17432 type:complete len:886 (+) Transcript_9101:747-3404(+)
MSKTLIIAEKPSVAQDIVRALTPVAGKFDKHDDHFENEHYVVSSAVGHLVEIAAPEEFDVKRGKWSFAHLPVIPPHFDLNPIDKNKGRLNALVKLIRRKDVTALINACDAGREGELIFRLIEQYAQPAKGPLNKPIQRLWLQSMTPAAIREGFEKLRSDEQMLPLADAARCRSEADWLVGINGTRAMTAFNSRDGGFFLTTVGRVQTPTLSIVVEREEKIRKHVARDYWELRANFDAQAGQYEGKWFDPAWKKNDDAERRADRLWNAAEADEIAKAVLGKPANVTEESKPSTTSCGALYDLTTLQREANSRFGFSAKTTLSIAQALYEKHKVLTYPRTDSRFLPEDYLAVAKQTAEMIAGEDLPGPLQALAAHARVALNHGYIKPTKKVFDNSKVSDHFAIIPTLQAPKALTEVEAKLYDLVVKRFLAVFFPPAEFLVTTRISKVEAAGKPHHFQTNGKVLVKPGWLAVYGKDVDDEDANLVPVQPGEVVRTESVDVKALQTKPPARYTEATLLSAMEGAGKLIDDDELREAMAEKGLGTPATRAATIEGLISEKYMLREGRELIPTAKAFQLMTLLRGLEVEDLTKPELTGDWESKLAAMEKGKLKREQFMAEIAAMTEKMVAKAKGYDRDTIPGDYATLKTPCPKCGGVVKENYRRFTCTGKSGSGDDACGFSIGKIPGGRSFELAEVEQFLSAKKIGPLEGFRSKAGWPFTAELALVFDAEIDNWKLEFDFGEDAKKAENDGEPVDFSGQQSLGACPKCQGHVYEHGANYVCEHAVGEKLTCDFKTGKVILTQPIEPAQVHKLLTEGKTDLLENFVSNKTRRKFKAFLAYDGKEGKVVFEFEPRPGKPAGKVAGKAAGKTVGKAAAKAAPAKKVARKSAAKA